MKGFRHSVFILLQVVSTVGLSLIGNSMRFDMSAQATSAAMVALVLLTAALALLKEGQLEFGGVRATIGAFGRAAGRGWVLGQSIKTAAGGALGGVLTGVIMLKVLSGLSYGEVIAGGIVGGAAGSDAIRTASKLRQVRPAVRVGYVISNGITGALLGSQLGTALDQWAVVFGALGAANGFFVGFYGGANNYVVDFLWGGNSAPTKRVDGTNDVQPV